MTKWASRESEHRIVIHRQGLSRVFLMGSATVRESLSLKTLIWPTQTNALKIWGQLAVGDMTMFSLPYTLFTKS